MSASRVSVIGIVTENVAKAIERAREIANEQDVICAAGSLYLAGEVKQIFPQTPSCAKRLKIS